MVASEFSCAHSSLGPKEKCVSTKKVQHFDEFKCMFSSQEENVIVTSKFSSPEQIKKKYVTPLIRKAPVLTHAAHKKLVESKEELVVQERDVSMSAEIFSTLGQQVVHSSFGPSVEISTDIVHFVVNTYKYRYQSANMHNVSK